MYGDYERCIEIYEHALRICPNHSLTLCNFGALLNDVKKDYSGLSFPVFQFHYDVAIKDVLKDMLT